MYVVGTQKNRQGDSSFEHPKHMSGLMEKKIITFYAKICLTGPIWPSSASSSEDWDFHIIS